MSSLKHETFRSHFVAMVLRLADLSAQFLTSLVKYSCKLWNGLLVSIITNNLPAVWLLQNHVLTATGRDVRVTDVNVVKTVYTDLCKRPACKNGWNDAKKILFTSNTTIMSKNLNEWTNIICECYFWGNKFKNL